MTHDFRDHHPSPSGPRYTEAQAERIVEIYRAALVVQHRDDGSIAVSFNPKSLLIENGIVIPELIFGDLCAALVASTELMMSLKNMIYTTSDNREIWAWCGELAIATNPSPFADAEHIIRLFRINLNALLVERSGATGMSAAEKLVNEANVIATYMSFPLLEAVLKFSLAESIDFDGNVKKSFCVKTGDQVTKYGNLPREKKKCSSVSDLLQHYMDVCDPATQKDLSILLACIALDRGEQLKTVYDWRNGSLHGAEGVAAVAGLIVGISLRISLSHIERDFNARQLYRLQSLAYSPVRDGARRSPWSIYPPDAPSSRPASWDGLFDLYGQYPIPADPMGVADRAQSPQDRDPFETWPSEGGKG